MNTKEIMEKYCAGEISMEEANKLFEEIGAPVHLVEGKNTITPEEAAATVVSDNPAEVSGWGLMNHGIGGMEKMHVDHGKFDYDTGFYLGPTRYPFYIGGKRFLVDGDHIAAEVE